MAATTSTITGRVWIIDAVDQTAEWLARLLSDQGHTVSVVADTRSQDESSHSPPDIVLIDARKDLPRALARADAGPGATAVTILLLGEDPPADLLPAIAATGADYLMWPARSQEIVTRVSLALHRRAHGPPAQRGPVPSAEPPLAEPQRGAATRQQAFGLLFRHAFEHLPLGAMIVSPANQIEQVNEALCRFIGYSPKELIGRQPSFMVLPEDHAATLAQGHLLAAGQINHFVRERRRYVRKDGSIRLGKVTVFAPRDEAGRPLAFLAFIEDIADRVWVEDQLARYTRYQQALANASLSLLTVASDEQARAAALREALQQLLDGASTSRAYLFRNVEDPQLGLVLALTAEAWSAGQRSLSDAPGATHRPLPYTILPESHRERILAGLPAGGLVEDIYAETPGLLQRVAAEGVRSTQTVPVHVDGQLWGFLGFDDYVEPRRWDHTDLMLLTSAASMVGQSLHRWQIEDDLRATSQFLHTTGRVARVGGWAIDVETRTPVLSEELVGLLELDPGVTLDLDRVLSFYAPEAQPLIRAAAAAAIRDGGGWELELPIVTARGRRIWVNSQGQAEQRDGRVTRLYGAVQDVTRRKEAELRLERQLQIESALVQCSRELLARVSSEDDLRRVAALALEHLRAALGIDQAYLMRLVPEPDDPHFTMLAFATIPIAEDVEAHPLARRFPLSLIPPARRAILEAGEALNGLPDRSQLVTPEQQSLLELDRAATRLTLPIRINDALWGVLGFNGLAERAWDKQEQTVLRTAAEMFSHVIRRWSAEDELQRNEEQFRTAVETMLDGFAIFDSVRDESGAITDFRYRYINEVGCRLNERTREEQLGRTLLELLPAHRDSELFADYIRLVETGLPVSRESLVYEDRYGSGERLARVFDVRAARLGDGFAVIWRDVTDRRLAHESLTRANDDLLRRVNELRTLNLVAQTLVFTHDLRAGLETVCAAVAERTGAASAAVFGLSRRPSRADGTAPAPRLDELAELHVLTPDDLGALGETLLTQRRPIALERRGLNFPFGEETLRRLQCENAAYLLLVPLSAPSGNLGLLVLQRGSASHPFSADHQSLAETVAGQVATAISNAQLGEQARRAAALAERNRVARDLHDSATQSLYSLVLMAGGWAIKAEKGNLTDIPARFTQLSAIAVQVLKELRLLIYQLRHPELEAGLLKALEERLAAVEQRANIKATLEVAGELPGLAPEDEQQLYVMLQEALNNALRHARASSVAVTIRVEAGAVVFHVRDDGVGFDPNRPTGGLGLGSMQERAAKIGARLTLSSEAGQGTCVEICVPLPITGGECRV